MHQIEGFRNSGIGGLTDKINKLKKIEFLNFSSFLSAGSWAD
ncbi:hypothetical protein D1AOALGA4SA_6975 [Olavius algarvensis Delta 1 endosymbiont]|nr:hypothetical protein D1AOALGA4SA_6975 [Olavius algarvensis Delta 1 endosymbiont]